MNDSCFHEQSDADAPLLRRLWRIFRQILRGYCAGQPINESRPRKGCC